MIMKYENAQGKRIINHLQYYFVYGIKAVAAKQLSRKNRNGLFIKMASALLRSQSRFYESAQNYIQ